VVRAFFLSLSPLSSGEHLVRDADPFTGDDARDLQDRDVVAPQGGLIRHSASYTDQQQLLVYQFVPSRHTGQVFIVV
jgi:hypothetical protein